MDEPTFQFVVRHRELVGEHVVQPGTGKAIEVLKAQILRIKQIEDRSAWASIATISTITRRRCM